MPVGFSSPARNLFLLASTAGGTLGNFFKTIDKSSGTNVLYRPTEIRNIYADDSYTLAGQAERSSGDEFGWIENVSYDGTTLTENWNNDIQSTIVGEDTTLRALEIDGNGNYLAVGKTGDIPWISRYTSAGVLDWSSTSNSADVEYYGVAVDSNNNYYACGNTMLLTGDLQAFVEKFDSSGNPGWGKSSIILGGDVRLNKIAANSRGEVIAVGYITEASSIEAKGYIVKIDTTTGEVQWDRSIECSYTDAATSALCEDVTIDDEDNFYIVGRLFSVGETRAFVARYSPEGNLIWQKETPFGEHFEYYQVRIDNITKQMITYGRYIDDANQQYGVLTKYESIGDQIWRRKMFVSNTAVFGRTGDGGGVNLDEDTQWYYMLYIDEFPNTDKYTFGRVSSSGNGLGAFQYAEGTGETVYYEILNIDDRVGRLSDGSVRNDSSDLVTYPFNANKLLFDDLATPITNKKVQVSEPNTFDYSGSPAVRRADFISLDFETETRTVSISSGDDVGQVDFTTVGTTDFTVPPNVTTISAVCVGGGGGAGATGGNRGGGGGAGGGLAYGTFTVTPGEVLRISVGAGGTFGVGTSNTGGNGGDTTITRLSDAAELLNGGGGSGGTVSPSSGNSGAVGTFAAGGTSTGTERDGGGTGGDGGQSRHNYAGGAGGGAAGYSGDGGRGSSGNNNGAGGREGSAGSGGGGSGGTTTTSACGGGGGVGIYGEGPSGTYPAATGVGGNGGSGGASGTVGNSASDGGVYGGGGGADDDDYNSGTNGNGVGGQGAARIIWGTGRSYPSTLTNNQTPSSSTTSSEIFVRANKNREGNVNGAVKNGSYWEFNGSNSYLEFTNFNGFKGGDNPFTVSLWVYADHGGTDADEHVFFYGDEATGEAIRIRLYENGGIGVGHWGGTGYDWGTNAGAYNLNEWTMITETYDGFNDRIYVNGVEVASNNSLNNLSIPTQATLYIGRRISGRYYSGNVGQVSCYDRALTAAQVFQNYNATKSKYINEASETAPKIGPGIVYNSDLLLNYNFGNRATYDRAHNLMPNGNQIGGPGWSNPGSNSSNLTTNNPSPTGENIASTWSGPGYYEVISGTQDGATYMMSVYAKQKDAGTDGYAQLLFGSDTGRWGTGAQKAHATFNLSNGDLVSTEPGVVSVGSEDVGNGWRRYYVSGVKTGGSDIAVICYTGNQGNGATMYAWGAQMEESSTLGRHVPTAVTAITPPTTVKNLSSSSNTSTITGATFNSAGYFEFDGTDDYISGSSTILFGTNAGSIEAWFKSSSTSTPGGAIYSESQPGDNTYWGHVRIHGGKPRFVIDDDNVIPEIEANVQVSDSNWHHLVVTGNGSNYAMYVDGVSYTPTYIIGSGYKWFNDTPGLTTYTIGALERASIGNYFSGAIGEVRIYDDALTASEVLQNFNATRSKYGV